MGIKDDIIIKMITKYMNTLGNKHINKMSCSDVKYNFSVEIADLFDYDSKWDFEDFLRDSYDYMVMIDSEVPVPVYLCEDYRKKYVKKNENIVFGKYPLFWEFVEKMKDDLKYMDIDLNSITFGKSGISFLNKEKY